MKTILSVMAIALCLAACKKSDAPFPGLNNLQVEAVKAPTSTGAVYKTFTIRQGQHYCDQNLLSSVTVSNTMAFKVKFNSSAVYTTVDPVNQYDLNKLWGFSEGLNNQYNSARVGWAYHNSSLRLYGYVYAKGVRYYQEITTIPFDTEISCSIKLNGSSYIITANGVSVSLPRGTNTVKASGYQQYPYFGGDETAPQDITIYIMKL